MHVSPASKAELERYLTWLEKQERPPVWGRDLAKELEKEITSLRKRSGSLAQLNETERLMAQQRIWQNFTATHPAARAIMLWVSGAMCSKVFGG